MGNCLKGGVSIDDVSLITDNTQQGDQTAGSMPTYQVSHGKINMHSTFSNSLSILTVSFFLYTHSKLLMPQPYSMQSESQQSLPIYYPAPSSSSRLVSQLGEEEQIQIAKRIGLIQHLPTGTYDGGGSSKKSRECIICMVEFLVGDSIRFLPCMHTYHVKCIDDWLMRSFICPSCMEPVDAALLSTFQ